MVGDGASGVEIEGIEGTLRLPSLLPPKLMVGTDGEVFAPETLMEGLGGSSGNDIAGMVDAAPGLDTVIRDAETIGGGLGARAIPMTGGGFTCTPYLVVFLRTGVCSWGGVGPLGPLGPPTFGKGLLPSPFRISASASASSSSDPEGGGDGNASEESVVVYLGWFS